MNINAPLRSLLVIGVFFPACLFAQNRPGSDTSSRQATNRAGSGIRPYTEVVTSRAKTDDGLFKVHKIEDTYLFEIPDSLMGADILVVNRISKAAAESRVQMMGYAGDQIGENVIRFEKGPGNRIFLKSISFQEMSKDSSSDGLYHSVINSNLQPIFASFDIKAQGRDSISGNRSSVIDVTNYLSTDNDILFFEQNTKRSLSLGQQQNDRSYTESIRSFPGNMEIRSVKTYIKTAGQGQALSAGGPVTYELNSSLILLPKLQMKPRHFDSRVGYFATSYTDFDANPQGVKRVTMINKWRLEPRDEDVQKYLDGELVEPKRQIVYYIDPATPKKWVPYLMAGVNDWNSAFEKAGWKNAIIAKEAPKNDPSWTLEGAGYSAIVYKPSDVPNASGPHVHDPRTGEILETHINWYHNVMNLLRNWYLIQASMSDKRARTMKFEDELMGQLIRFVSSHEVGHTLGLRHNYGSSSTVPVEKLRDKAWVEANGHTPSIMDYARFNYVAQPEDNIDTKGLYPRIGDYDKWAIEWGYRWFPDLKTAEEEETKLNAWVIEKTSGSSRLWFGTESDANDPRAQNEDLGDNAMTASAYGIRNLKRILPNILDWSKEENEGYTNARALYNELTLQFGRYMGHVTKNIGGIMTTPRTIEEKANVVEFVSRAKQREAMSFLQDHLFKTPTWILDKKIFSLTGTSDLNTISGLQSTVLSRLISGTTLNKLVQFEAFSPAEAYTVSEMMTDLKKGIWNELPAKKPIDIYRRNLQKIYVERLLTLVAPVETSTSVQQGGGISQGGSTGLSKTNDALSIVKGHIRSLITEIKTALPVTNHAPSKMHLQDLLDRLIQTMENKKS